MTPEENKTLVRRFFDAFGHNDFAALEAVTHQDVVYHTAPPGLSAGIEGYRELMAMYVSAFPDVQITVDDMIAEGDKVVTRFTSRGTQQGEFMGIPPAGTPVTIGGISIIHVAGNKVAEEWDQLDMLGGLQQLGATLVPAQRSATA